MEFAKVSKRENRVYVGNLSYDVKYRDLLEFMRGGEGLVVVAVVAVLDMVFGSGVRAMASLGCADIRRRGVMKWAGIGK